ncbi:hypothetical protein K2173_019043 [Erythroxylum novogranatense]|uniref:Protein FAR1-RELATED SEQUENCE n=1 Tax=Erythroxylum novogranatense TaxID=1862640 RepID=A0AAV8SSK4_9ROSI|nr:hypothetical protein K2173_019043 [Erythroxylum novogranatense]
MMLNTAIYDSLKVEEFEMAWENMVQHFQIADHEWLQTFYEDRERWVPIYSKDTMFAGLSCFQKGGSMSPFFDGYVHQQTSLKEFFDIYELVLQKKHQKEAIDDIESRDSSSLLKTARYYEMQLSGMYTNDIFRKFQDEIVMMSSCFGIAQVHASGPIFTYMVQEKRGEEEPNDVRKFEVVYDKTGAEVRCICNCFNFKGYLCRHALCVLDYNGVGEVPFQYILARWRKDFKRLYVPDFGSNNVDIANPVQWFDHLYKRAMQVVEEGMTSQSHSMVAWQAFKESLNNVRLVADKHSPMAEAPCSNELVLDNKVNDNKKQMDGGKIGLDDPYGVPDERKEFVAPAVGMEFESYEDAYNYYNCYAKEMGFRVRVKNSWFKRNSREKYGAVLCCSSQGFKRIKDVNRLRKETRTGCPAMIRMRLVDSKRWRVLEVTIEHNHLLGAKIYKPVKKIGSGNKRKSHTSSNAEVRTIKLYRALVIDAGANNGNSSSDAREVRKSSEFPNQLNLKRGDAQAIHNYLCRMQLTNPSFFYLMDLNDEGHLRNVFWVDARSRASCGYFSDVVYIDTTCLLNKYEIPLVALVGVNQHGQSVLLGCGLLAGETTEAYIWLLKAWHTCVAGFNPQTIITDRSQTLQTAVAETFPRSHHCFGLSHIMKRVPEKLGGLRNYDAIRKSLMKAVYETLKVIEFEAAWGFMVQRFGVGDHEWLRSLYEDRVRWAPVYLKDTYFAGMSAARPGEILSPFFERYVHKQTPLKEFLDKYELALHKKHKEETLADIESRSSGPILKTRCSFELQLSKVYTREIFKKFQFEVEEMYSCFSTTQIHIDGPIIIFLVKERLLGEGNRREIRDYEVLYNRSAAEVRCICSCFNFYGYLCRHALCVLNFNGVEEIPPKYILSRWKKDYKRLYIPDHSSSRVDATDRVQWFNQLYRSALQVVEEGVISLDHYSVALQAFEESLNRVHEVELKQDQL